MKIVFSILLMSILILSESASLSALLSDEHMEMTEQSSEDTTEKEAKEKRFDVVEKISHRSGQYLCMIDADELDSSTNLCPILEYSQYDAEINLPPPKGIA